MTGLLKSPLFTVEEENLICVFGANSRTALMGNIGAAMPIFDEPLMAGIAENALGKLHSMTDAEFAEYIFHPAYHEEEDDDMEDVEDDTVLIEVFINESISEGIGTTGGEE